MLCVKLCVLYSLVFCICYGVYLFCVERMAVANCQKVIYKSINQSIGVRFIYQNLGTVVHNLLCLAKSNCFITGSGEKDNVHIHTETIYTEMKCCIMCIPPL